MKIYGLQKMTLLDYPGKVAATVFLGGCNLMCPFCHNYEIAAMSMPPEINDEEFWEFLAARKGMLDGIAITGGEPCINEDLPDFIARIKDMGYLIKLDTNGFFPDMLEKLLNMGLVDYVAMDIKNSPQKYAVTVGLDDVDMAPIMKSISIIMRECPDYEFRTTLIKKYHNISDIKSIGEMIARAKKYFLQKFADRPTVPVRGLSAPDDDTIREFLECAREFVQTAQIRGLES